jgi:cobaltochelatase CobN
MHLLVRESRTLDEDQPAVDLGHKPADLVFLSFADSDLGAAASAWAEMSADRPSLRLANLASLRHPMSVDLYAERAIAHARCVLVRLLGGIDYWRYGAEELAALCRARDIALALLPGDAREDTRLADLSTVDAPTWERFTLYLRYSGPENLRQALLLAGQLGGIGEGPQLPPQPLPVAGDYALSVPEEGRFGSAAIVFYRSHLLAGDIAPVAHLAHAVAAQGLGARALYVSSLKDEAAGALVANRLRAWGPAVVLNLTGFSARRDDGGSPLDAAGAPVIQLVLAGSQREGWESSFRGLSQADLAMQVVLPEIDGRLLGPAVAFKSESEQVPGLQFVRTVFRAEPEAIERAARQCAGWARLAATPRAERRVAMLLSDYPGAGGQIGHAVGLDTIASMAEIAAVLRGAGYALGELGDFASAPRRTILWREEYRRLFAQLPAPARERIIAAWGEPQNDITLAYIEAGNLVVAVQPDRGHALDRKATYHDPDLPPCHNYVGCYLWLGYVLGIHALIHLGTHGTLEWLPGKAVALSPYCYPALLADGVPVIYPFIVNNPGEAAVAKRRLGAVTIGHLTPPLRAAGAHGAALELERLIEEFAAADGLDRRRTALLRRDILDRATATGLLAESGVAPGMPEQQALARLDAYLCDLKDLQIRDGLHVFGCAPEGASRETTIAALQAMSPGSQAARWRALLDLSAETERDALLAALDGRFVPPGPAGAPSRGRADVLPTGRNLFTVDPRAIPTRSALALAERAAGDLLRCHLQEHGDWPRALVLDIWGSTTMRTGGEDLALALVLLGARPVWDEGSARVSGFEIVPLAVLDRPRVDVTLRISGLFRDVFAAQVALFDAVVRAIAARDEDLAWNPLAAAARGLAGDALRQATARAFGPAPGCFGAGIAELLQRGAWEEQGELGAAYLAASGYAYGKGLDGAEDGSGLTARVAAADGFVHTQDHAETDVLESVDVVAHEGGFGAASALLGRAAALYHLDTARPEAPRTRLLIEELRRIVRSRAANPAWIAGMMRHGYRGAAEIARSADVLHGYAAILPDRLDAQFDLLFDATLGDEEVDAFLRAANPDARAGMVARFQDAIRRGLWCTRRNAVTDKLAL